MHLKMLTIITDTGTDAGMVRDLFAIPSILETWTRTTTANGGYYTGSFEISGVAESDIVDFFNRYLGHEVQEHTINKMTWNGFIYRMTLEAGGTQYTRTLEPDYFHNRVKCYYSNLEIMDTNQGALTYRIAPLRFSDAGQDFSAWQTLAGNAVYRIQVANTDGTTSWAYLGAASTVINPNDTIAVYQDVAMTTPGWNDQDPIAGGQTPASYQVIEIEFEGERYQTDWAEVADSEDVFGTVEYILSLGGAEAAAADALRDRHLDEYGYPRTRMSGGIEIVTGTPRRESPVLTVEVAGFVATLFWRYRTTSRTETIRTLLIETTNLSEFVSASTATVDTNTLLSNADCYPMPQRLGDLIQVFVDQGDAAGNPYKWGVYDRTLYYRAQPTASTYTLKDGLLYDLAGTQVIPQLVRPGFLLQTRDAPAGLLPLGGSAFDVTNVAYIEEVEFTMPDRLRLTLSDPNSLGTIGTQIQAGTYTGTLGTTDKGASLVYGHT